MRAVTETSLSELAQVRADRVAGTGRASMSSNRARVLGAAGRVVECRAAVSAAEEYFAAHQPLDESGSALFHAAWRDPGTVPVVIDRLRAVLAHPDDVSPPRHEHPQDRHFRAGMLARSRTHLMTTVVRACRAVRWVILRTWRE